MGSITSTKPTILMVPGAWHVKEYCSLLVEELSAKGYKCVAIDLPSTSWSKNGKAAPTDFNEDVEAIRSSAEQLLDAGEEVLLWLHSYAGICGQSACKGLDKKTRSEQGKKGGIAKVVFCTAFAIPEGMSVFKAIGENDSPWNYSDDRKSITLDDTANFFYNDIPPSALLTHYVESLLPMAVGAFFSDNRYYVIQDVPCVYIKCTLDNAIPIQAQESYIQGMKDACKQKGDDWLVVETLESSHSPFLSMPEATANCVRRAAGEDV